MKRSLLTGLFGLGCLTVLSACVVEPARPVFVAPAPVAAPPVVVDRQVIVDRPVIVERRRVVRACPIGFHLGPRGRACRPNRR